MSALAVLWAVAISGAWAAEPGTEFVIVLDNSCSMVEPHSLMGKTVPAADPNRQAVLGAQLVEGLTRGTGDELTVLSFPITGRGGVLEVEGASELRDLRPAQGTWFAGPLIKARRILNASDKQSKMLLFLSDGEPNDYLEPDRGRELLGLPEGDFDTLVLGLFPGENARAEGFLKPLARQPEDYVRVADGATLVSQFTRAYAHALGSKAHTGTLAPGESHTVEVGKYVSEVLAVTTDVERTGSYSASLKTPDGPVMPRATGDNGCSSRPRKNPGYCDPPRLHWAVWRVPHDPEKTDSWTIGLDKANGAVAWGVILKYDFSADIELPPDAKVGKSSPIRARLVWDGKTVDDPSFFAQDGFEATATVGGKDVALTHVGGGVFEGEFTPETDDPTKAEVRFRNTWMEKRARGKMGVADSPPLSLVVEPMVLDLGEWQGERRATESCGKIELLSNHAFDPAKTQWEFLGFPNKVAVDIRETPEGAAVCVRVKGCCGNLVAPENAVVQVSATDADGSTAQSAVNVVYKVNRTGFLTCWWPWILALLLLLFILWFLYGWIRPHDFDQDLTVKIAGSKRQLGRAAALVLREQPKGRRGFYRNARVSVTHAGDFVANYRNAGVWLEATGRGDTTLHLKGPLEIKDRRTKKWVRVTEEEAGDGVRTQVDYRLGDIYMRFQ